MIIKLYSHIKDDKIHVEVSSGKTESKLIHNGSLEFTFAKYQYWSGFRQVLREGCMRTDHSLIDANCGEVILEAVEREQKARRGREKV